MWRNYSWHVLIINHLNWCNWSDQKMNWDRFNALSLSFYLSDRLCLFLYIYIYYIHLFIHRGGVGEAIAILDSGYYLSQVPICFFRSDIKIHFIFDTHTPTSEMFVFGINIVCLVSVMIPVEISGIQPDIILDIRYPAWYQSKYSVSGVMSV